jgi:hypothetical protein
MAAAAGGDIECCVELIKAGCSLNQVDLDGKSAGRFAQEAANEVVSRFLVNVTKAGLEGALQAFVVKQKEMLSHEKLMIAYGGSAGECGGPDDEAGDYSYLWRLPPPKPLVGSGEDQDKQDGDGGSSISSSGGGAAAAAAGATGAAGVYKPNRTAAITAGAGAGNGVMMVKSSPSNGKSLEFNPQVSMLTSSQSSMGSQNSNGISFFLKTFLKISV